MTPKICPRCGQDVDDASDAVGVAEDAAYWCRKCRMFLTEDDAVDFDIWSTANETDRRLLGGGL